MGGVYAPTNELGQVIYNDLGLALADASYKFAYETVLSVFRFEQKNRTAIFQMNPKVCLDIKHAMDKAREQVWAVDLKWAATRKAYRLNPTPAGLTTLQTILAEIQRIVPAVQADITPVYSTLASQPVTQ